MPPDAKIAEKSPQVSGVVVGSTSRATHWRVAGELPVILLYSGQQFGVMMLSPADIKDFAIGFTLTEGIVGAYGEISDVRIEPVSDGLMVNIIVSAKALKRSKSRMRSMPGRSSCGLCGAQSLEAALARPKLCTGLVPEPEFALDALKNMAAKQPLNQQNFSMHAAALCALNGEILMLREDVGRHNALDKLCGSMARAGLSAADGFLALTSRFSVELAQKSAAMGFCFVATISAPTALALKVAGQANIQVATLAGDGLMLFENEG